MYRFACTNSYCLIGIIMQGTHIYNKNNKNENDTFKKTVFEYETNQLELDGLVALGCILL